MVPPELSPPLHDAVAERTWLRRQARRMLGRNLRSVVDSQDLVQEVQVAALRAQAGKHFENERAFRSWLLVILRNLTAQLGRDWKRRRPSAEDVAWSRLPGTASTPASSLVRRDGDDGLRRRLAHLSERDRQVVLLRIVEDHSFAEIGRRLGIREANARVLFNRNLRRLRERTAPEDRA